LELKIALFTSNSKYNEKTKGQKERKKKRNLPVEGSEAIDIGRFASDVVELDAFSRCHDWRR
jgi:hypothetical protein